MLKDLLKSLQPEDTILLELSQRNVLHDFVIRSKYQDGTPVHLVIGWNEIVRLDLILVIIGALGLLGDATSIPVLEDFAADISDPTICAVAFQSIRQIHARIEYDSDQMLRASKAPEQRETLLRANSADNPQNGDPKRLLRADNSIVDQQEKKVRLQADEQSMHV